VPTGLHRYFGANHLHFITCSCYQRRALLGTANSRNLFLRILEETRQRYRFAVVGYVVMPEHVHLLLSEPEVGGPSTVMQVLKQRTARAMLPMLEKDSRTPFWLERFYDFNIWSEKKKVEKLRYMHRNPLKRGLTVAPEDWQWSSYRFYASDEIGPVRVNEGWGEISFRDRVA
jgi:putative transposase